MGVISFTIALQDIIDNQWGLSLAYVEPNTGSMQRPHKDLAPVSINFDQLNTYANEPQAYGKALSEMIFQEEAARLFLMRACWLAEQHPNDLLSLQVQLPLRPLLHSIRWELLSNPGEKNRFFAQHQQRSIIRIPGGTAAVSQPQGRLRVLALVANPLNPEAFNLQPIPDPPQWVGMLQQHTTAPIDVHIPEPIGHASLQIIKTELSRGYDLLYLVAHGVARSGYDSGLILTDAQGKATRVTSDELLQAVGGLRYKPRLVVLVSCHSSGRGIPITDEGEVSTLCARLAEECGVPAVVAMQGAIRFDTAASMIAKLCSELFAGKRLDEALAQARYMSANDDEWWRVVLYSRFVDSYRLLPSIPEFPATDTAVPPKMRLAIGLRNVADTDLIGRENDLTSIETFLLRPDHRLITLLGIGGIGKSRLAREIIRRYEHLWTDGYAFISLEDADNRATTLQAMSDQLGIKSQGVSEMNITDFLRDRHLLIALDNLEQIPDAQSLVRSILETAAEVTIIATSRIPLNIEAEQQYIVNPLAHPDQSKLTAVPKDQRVATVLQAPSIQLFMQAVQRVRHDFSLNADTALLVAEICARLDGLPLAIKLVAPHVKRLSMKDIQTKLRTGILPMQGGVDLPARQQTLENTIAWSLNLLTPEEREAFQVLGVFVGGCDLAAAEAVLGQSIAHTDSYALIEKLEQHNLVQFESGRDRGERYTMLVTLQDAAAKQLAVHPQRSEIQKIHAEYYYQQMVALFAMHNELAESLRIQLDHERGNIRAALQWFIEQSQITPAVFMASRLWKYWYISGDATYALDILNHIHQLADSRAQDPKTVEGRSEFGGILHGIGALHLARHDFDRAEHYLGAALEHYRQQGDQRNSADVQLNYANIYYYQNNVDESRRHYEEALSLAQMVGDTDLTARALNNLGNLMLDTDELDMAHHYYQQSLLLAQHGHNRSRENDALSNLGEHARIRGDVAGAADYYRQSLKICQETNNVEGQAITLGNLGLLALEQDKIGAAITLLDQALLLIQKLGMRLGAFECVLGVARCAAIQGSDAIAATLFGALEAQDSWQYVPEMERERYRSEQAIVRQRCGEVVWNSAKQIGETLHFSTILKQASNWTSAQQVLAAASSNIERQG